MKHAMIVMAAMVFAASAANAQPKLTWEAGVAGDPTDVAGKTVSEYAAANKLATIQLQTGKTLTKSVLQVAQGKTDVAATPFVLHFLLSKGLGPYSGVGRKKGAELAGNLRLLYPYHIAHFYLIAFSDTGIDSWDKLKGKTVFNGPPRGGALTTARSIIRLVTGLRDGKGYNGRQIAWGQSNSIFLDRSVDAAVRPAQNPAPYMPIYLAAGKLNLISIPKAKFEGKVFQKFLSAPGRVPLTFPVSDMAHYGKNAVIISEDKTFRAVSAAGGDTVHKNMPKALAKGLTNGLIKSLPQLFKKVPFAKGQLFGVIDDKKMGICRAGVKLHPGAIEAWEEAGHKVPDCAKPKS